MDFAYLETGQYKNSLLPMHIWRLASINTVGHWMFCGQKGAWKKKNCLGAFALYFMALWLGLAPCLDYFVFKFGLAVCLESFAFNFGFALSLVHIATCSGVAIVLIRLRPERFAQQQVGGRDPLAEMSKSGSRSLHPFQCGMVTQAN